MVWFQFAGEEGGGLSSEHRPGRGIYSFLRHLAFAVEPSPGLDRLTVIGFKRYRTVHVLQLFFSVPVGQYYTEIGLLAFSWKIPLVGLPPVTELLMPSSTVWRAIFAVSRKDHLVHVNYIPPSGWQTALCKRPEKQT